MSVNDPSVVLRFVPGGPEMVNGVAVKPLPVTVTPLDAVAANVPLVFFRTTDIVVGLNPSETLTPVIGVVWLAKMDCDPGTASTMPWLTEHPTGDPIADK